MQSSQATQQHTRQSILFVDDDVLLPDVLAEEFEAGDEFTVTTAGSIADATERFLARDADFQLVILDDNLPDGTGFDLCAELRRKKVMVPIIMIISTGEQEDIDRGFEAGATAYIERPIRLAELTARLRAHLPANNA